MMSSCFDNIRAIIFTPVNWDPVDLHYEDVTLH